MKDFYDVHLLASSFPFGGPTLVGAIRATFERRGVAPPGPEPLVLTRAYLAAPERQTQWRAFLRRGRLGGPMDAGELADALTQFLGPVLAAIGRDEAFSEIWQPGGPWETAP